MRASAREFNEVYLHYLKNGLGLTLLTAVHNQAVVCEWDSESSQGTAEICSASCLRDVLWCRGFATPLGREFQMWLSGECPLDEEMAPRNASTVELVGVRELGTASTGASWQLVTPVRVQIPNTQIRLQTSPFHISLQWKVPPCPAPDLIWQCSFNLCITFSVSNAKGLENLSESPTDSLACFPLSLSHLAFLCSLITSIH